MKAFDYYLSSTLCFIGGGLILGLTLNDPESHSKSIIQAVMSERYFYVLLIEMAISGQMLLDIIIDNISAGKKMFSTKGSKVNLSVLLSLFISSLLIISYVMPYSKYVFLISIRQSRLIFMYAITVSMAQHYNKAMWNSTYLKVSFFITSTGSILRIISVSGGVEPQGIYASCSKASWALILISGIPTIIYFVGKWSWQIYYTSKKRNLTADEINCTVYVFTYIICTILVLIASSTFDPAYLGSNLSLPANTEDYFAMSFDLIYTVYVVIIGMHQVRTLRKEATQYKNELEFKKMFVSYISHEVRTPLNTAIMGLQLLTEELSGCDSEHIETVKDIKTACDIAVTVLNEILTLDKLEAGTLVLEKTEFNVMDFVQETVHPFQLQAKKAGVELKVTVNSTRSSNNSMIDACREDFSDKVVLSADRNKLSQVLRNLVSNGLKFTPPGGCVDVVVNIILSNKGNQMLLKVDVVDSGAGISLENQTRLFKEIVQFNPGKLQGGGGSGLGLFISHGIMQLHGGGLSVHSEGEGYGCTFTLELPILTAIQLPEFVRSSSSSSRIHPREISTVTTNANANANATGESSMEGLLGQFPLEFTSPNNVDGGGDRRERMMPYIDGSPYDCSLNLHQVEVTEGWDKFKMRNTTVDPKVADGRRIDIGNEQPTAPSKLSEVRMYPIRILVVDDSAMSRKMQCRLLKKRCMSCIEAEDGMDAVNKIRTSMTSTRDQKEDDNETEVKKGTATTDFIDMIIMDANMPVMGGLEATRRIRDMGYKGLIMGVTGNVTPHDISTFMSHGANIVFPKPLDINKFDSALDKHFQVG